MMFFRDYPDGAVARVDCDRPKGVAVCSCGTPPIVRRTPWAAIVAVRIHGRRSHGDAAVDVSRPIPAPRPHVSLR